ncbi:MAG: hypothetical protein EOP83_25230 [Verrucomicrobiaceae bacterium]|nr:MAG: hypothetical protein EOP83_25230 [Verrucomicrobiaceae bacterium]
MLSYRRARTLELWCRDHIGEGRMLITPNDLFSFTTESDMIVFATVWNGVEVPMCAPEDASR